MTNEVLGQFHRRVAIELSSLVIQAAIEISAVLSAVVAAAAVDDVDVDVVVDVVGMG